MSGYKHGASTADPIRRAAHMIQALRYQLAQKDVELQAAHAHAEKLRARLDRHENPPRHWGQGNERLWEATREVADWERRNPSRAAISKRRDKAVRQLREEHN